jgi:hypothetical protein
MNLEKSIEYQYSSVEQRDSLLSKINEILPGLFTKQNKIPKKESYELSDLKELMEGLDKLEPEELKQMA